MQAKISVITCALLLSSIFTFVGCFDNKSCLDYTILQRSFTEAFSFFYQRDDVYLIKGVAGKVHGGYGRKIDVIEDLKGNFKDKSDICVWGQGNPLKNTGCPSSFEEIDQRFDRLQYDFQTNDTLIMMLFKIKKGNNFIEKSGDYETLPCTHGVLRLSNGYVSGCIYGNNLAWGEWVDGDYIVWEDLFMQLLNYLNLEDKPPSKIAFSCPFYITHKMHYHSNDVVFLMVKHLGNSYEYGIEAINIADLKGNYPERHSFFVWGDYSYTSYHGHWISYGRCDDLRLYNKDDTLLVLVSPLNVYRYDNSPEEENPENFATFSHAVSVLKYSNDFVSGYIISTLSEEQTMSWNDFQQLFNPSSFALF